MAVPAGVGRRLVGASIPVDLHQPDSGFHQAAGQEHTLAERGLPIAVPVGRRLLLQSEGPPGLGGAQEIERLPGLLIEHSGGRPISEGIQPPLNLAK